MSLILVVTAGCRGKADVGTAVGQRQQGAQIDRHSSIEKVVAIQDNIKAWVRHATPSRKWLRKRIGNRGRMSVPIRAG